MNRKLPRRLSLDGYLEVLSHEAIVTSRYKDSVGVWTISVGHTKAAGGVDPAKVTRTLSLDECLDIFIEDVPKYERAVHRLVTASMTQMEFDAWFSFVFNTGGGRPATCIKKFNAGDKAGAIKSIMAWKKPPEIIGRRKKERDLLAGKGYSHDGKVSVYPATKGGAVQWGSGKRIDARRILHGKLLVGAPSDPVEAPPPPDIETPDKPSAVRSGGLWAWLFSLFNAWRKS